MRIKSFKVNGFGNLENKEFELKPGINLIQGKNETGKTSLLKFIVGMLYGLSRNKNGKDIPDFERYKPWKTEEYSGKMKYELDNGENYEIFREFNKKSPKLYNDKTEEISKQYTIDKNRGNEFFYEQTKVTEEMLVKTAVVSQTETKLEKSEQNILLQKISNLVSTGDDTISYKKAIEKLNRKQMEEVGTERSTERPINIVREKIKNNEEKLKELEQYKEQKKQIEESLVDRKKQVTTKEKQLDLLKKIKQQKEKQYLEQEKININKNSIFESEEKLKEIENKLKNQKKAEVFKVNKIHIFALILLIIITIVQQILIQNIIITAVLGSATLIYLVLQIANKIKIDNKTKKAKQAIDEEINKLKREKEFIQDTINKKDNEIKKQEEKQKNEQEQQKSEIRYEYLGKIDVEDINKNLELNHEELIQKIDAEEKDLNEIKITNHAQEVNLQNILQKLEELAQIEENIEELNEEQKDILALNDTINLVREALQQSYEEMKENITPEFTQNLGNIMAKTSNGKYKNIKFNDIEGLTVELETGDYINCERLSIGTIDQMYLALRLSALKEIAQEKMPIILDEAFVYYDDDRLKNILEYIENNYKEHQIIILTCTNREQKALEELNICANICNM